MWGWAFACALLGWLLSGGHRKVAGVLWQAAVGVFKGSLGRPCH